MSAADRIFNDVSALSLIEKDRVIDKLISDLDKSDPEINEMWVKEAKDRIDAYDQRKMKAISLKKLLQKYK